ncbi:MAG: SpoIID/LytB domain-containing protein [Clostridiales bacterium]|jgi:stage II sporulation protein D|nr:SpoIID/LytB domain-containing protein [Clostridiales bacterium]
MKINKKLQKAMRIFSFISVWLFTSCALLSGRVSETGINDNAVIAPPREAAENIDNTAHIAADAENLAPIGDDIPVSRALAAKMTSLIYNDINDIASFDREITFSDTDSAKWYDKFINAAYIQSVMLGYGDKFKPEDALSLEHAQLILDNINPENTVKVKMNAGNKDLPISYALFTQMYKKFLENTAGEKSVSEMFSITEKNIVVLATKESNSKLSGFNLISDTGPLTFYGLVMDSYLNKQIRVLVKENEIIAVTGIVSETPEMKNCYIVNVKANGITIFTGGAERFYEYPNANPAYAGKICDITVDGAKVLDITVYETALRDKILRFNQNEFEFAENGIRAASEDFKVYSVADGSVKWKAARDLMTGTDIAVFYTQDSQVRAAVIDRNPLPQIIRVALNNSAFTSLYHEEIKLSADTGYTVKIGENERKFEKGEEFSVSGIEDANIKNTDRIYITPDIESGRVEIIGLKRNWPDGENPKYRGVIEIGKADGYLTLTNEVGLEEYLYSVVPSEMPSSHGVEAAKVQAVTARSYAYNQFYSNRYHNYGANVDDSVNSQVYNNIPENEISVQAVNETAGLCLTYSGQVVSANFFSTSAGVTANSGDVWANAANRRFPAHTQEYLKSVKLYEGEDFGDLSVEENAAKFFKAQNVEGFDKNFPWFRWETVMTAEEITQSVNSRIGERYNANPYLIKTLQENGIYLSRPVVSVGSVKNIEVLKRGAGGNIMEMKITGTEATVKVLTEYNIRMLIAPKVLTRHNGSAVENFGMMPSAFFTSDVFYNENGNLQEAVFYGGGYGHGVGMSQNGVKGMIDMGYSLGEILARYYSGCKVEKVA